MARPNYVLTYHCSSDYTEGEIWEKKKTQIRIFAMFREQAHLIDDMKSI